MNIDIERIIAAAPENMVLIPAGEFQMGSDNGKNDEKPVHTVYVDAFYMDVYPVTLGQYKTFLRATGHRDLPPMRKSYTRIDLHPIMGVNWRDAMAYARWADKRLPTEAEWEKAARGGLVGKTYPWGNAIDPSKANYGPGYFSISRLAPVGSYSANGYGLYDMAGGVSEWCLDAYEKDFYGRSPRENPLAGEMSLSEVITDFRNVKTARVLRGGSFAVTAQYSRVARRASGKPHGSVVCQHGLMVFVVRSLLRLES